MQHVGAVAVHISVNIGDLVAVDDVGVEVVVIVVEAVGDVDHQGDQRDNQGDQVQSVQATQDAYFHCMRTHFHLLPPLLLPSRQHHVDDVGAVAIHIGVYVGVLHAVDDVGIEVVVIVVETVAHIDHQGGQRDNQGDQVQSIQATQDAYFHCMRTHFHLLSSLLLPPRRHHIDYVGAVAVHIGVNVGVLRAVETVGVEVVVIVVEAVAHIDHQGDQRDNQGDQVEGVLATQDAVGVDALGPRRLGTLHVDERSER